MKHSAFAVGAVLSLVAAGATPAAAADKAHQQLMAEIRMLQEQQQQLQQMVGGLTEALKVVTTKIDDQTGTNRKAFADQKLLIDNGVEGVRRRNSRPSDRRSRQGRRPRGLRSYRDRNREPRANQEPLRQVSRPRPCRPHRQARRRSFRRSACTTTPTATTWAASSISL